MNGGNILRIDPADDVLVKTKELRGMMLSFSNGTAVINHLLTPCLMEPEGSMADSQGLSNNSYPDPNQLNSS